MKFKAMNYFRFVSKKFGLSRAQYKPLIFLDEEVGGSKGMVPFVASQEFKGLNIGLALDEGTGGGVDNRLQVVWAERAIYRKALS